MSKRIWNVIARIVRYFTTTSTSTSSTEVPGLSTPSTQAVEFDLDATHRAELKEADWECDPEDVVDRYDTDAAAGFYIGWAGFEGAGLYSAWVTTPQFLRRHCGEFGGFVWGRHAIVVEPFKPHETESAVLEFGRDYCRNTVGKYNECEFRLGQIGQWEREDMKNSYPDAPPPPAIEVRLLGLSSPDVNLANFRPDDGADFDLRIHARVGAGDAGEAATYEFILCTPARVRQLRDLSQISLFDGFAFMNRFDPALLEREVRTTCAALKGYTTAEAIAKFGRYASRLSTDNGFGKDEQAVLS